MGLRKLPLQGYLKHLKSLIAAAVLSSAMSVNPVFAILTPENSITFTAGNHVKTTISVVGADAIAMTPGIGRQTLVKDIASVPEYARDIWIDDFNFDGAQDVALTTHIDAASQDQFYSIFTWDKGLQQFIPLPFPSRLSNLEKDKTRKEIRSSYKTGDFWTEDTYRFDGSTQPYLFSRSELLTIDLWHTTIYDRKGKILKSLVSIDGRLETPPSPVSMPVITRSAPLYSEPLPSTRLPIDLAHGEMVTLIDFQHGLENFHWVLVQASPNGHFIKAWMLLSNLLDSGDY